MEWIELAVKRVKSRFSAARLDEEVECRCCGARLPKRNALKGVYRIHGVVCSLKCWEALWAGAQW